MPAGRQVHIHSMVAESREEKELFNELQSHLKYALGMYSCMLQQQKKRDAL